MTSIRELERRLEQIEPETDLPSLSLAMFLSAEETELVSTDPPIVECDGELYQDSHGVITQLSDILDDDGSEEDE